MTNPLKFLNWNIYITQKKKKKKTIIEKASFSYEFCIIGQQRLK